MAGSSFLDVCRFAPTLGGTTDWTYSAAVTGYQSPAAAGVVNGAQYSYRAESADLTQWEIGVGTYNTGTGVLTRGTVLFNSLGTTAKINFSTVPQVAIVGLAEDLPGLGTVNVFAKPQAFSDTTAATAYNSAAVTIAGGLGIAGNIRMGTGAAGGGIILNGSSGTNAGPLVDFAYNGTVTFGFGRSAGILGGTADDFVITATERADGVASIDISRGANTGSPSGGVVGFMNGLGVPVGGSASAHIGLGGTGALGIYWGSGAPTVSAAQGSLYIRTDGSSTSTRLYVNTNGTTGWTNFTSAT